MPDLQTAIAFLKGAVERGQGGLNAYYAFDGNTITTRNMVMLAGTPWDNDCGVFSVPAQELETALARMTEAPVCTFDEQTVQVSFRQGRLHSTISCLKQVPPPPAIDWDTIPWENLPSGFNAALKAARPFLSNDPSNWTSCMRLMGDRVTAINNRSGIDITVPNMAIHPVCLVTSQCVDFIVKRDPAQHIAAMPGALWLRWPTGCWLSMQLLVGEFPATVETILTNAGTAAPVTITKDWRAAYADAEALSGGSVLIHPDKIVCGKGAGQNQIAAKTAISSDKVAYWEVATLSPVIALATHWNPAAAPNPALFIGPNLRGVIAPVRG